MSQAEPTDGDTTGTLKDSYLYSIQNGDDRPADDDMMFGVVRRQKYGIRNIIDINYSSLSPSDDLLTEFKQRADEVGHNTAVDDVNFRERYQQQLSNFKPQRLIEEITILLEGGTDVWLVCYENTDEKFCHRDLLKEVINERIE